VAAAGDILQRLDLRPGKTVVDLGSGAGYFALKIAPRVALILPELTRARRRRLAIHTAQPALRDSDAAERDADR
jgi:tRNA A58 N-methylase Trm61